MGPTGSTDLSPGGGSEPLSTFLFAFTHSIVKVKKKNATQKKNTETPELCHSLHVVYPVSTDPTPTPTQEFIC